ncbi:MAG TPA: FMN-binding negative transcriptional regulator [Roseiarcus sp.]|nr:FMN-binding negative transcriptional regulator [Roseiarcus sp.]
MYEPPLHRETDLERQHALIAARRLGLLISCGPQGLVANAVPFLLDRAASRLGTLKCHVARANPQWRDLAESPEALVVFQGADHYVSPSWYATKRETHKVVPTWNYVMVQARGAARVIEDDAWLQRQIEALTARQESSHETPWAVGDAPADFIALQRKAIVGLEIEISDIRGKWKTSQNRSAADRAGVVENLERLGDEEALAMAAIVRETGNG